MGRKRGPDLKGSFSLWDARFGRGITSQLSTCGRLFEHFIERVQRIGTVAMDRIGKADGRSKGSEDYMKQLLQLSSLSSGTQTLRHECEMEFVTRMP